MSDFREFVDDYYRRFVEVLETFDRAPMVGVLATLERVRDGGGTIWVALEEVSRGTREVGLAS